MLALSIALAPPSIPYAELAIEVTDRARTIVSLLPSGSVRDLFATYAVKVIVHLNSQNGWYPGGGSLLETFYYAVIASVAGTVMGVFISTGQWLLLRGTADRLQVWFIGSVTAFGLLGYSTVLLFSDIILIGSFTFVLSVLLLSVTQWITMQEHIERAGQWVAVEMIGIGVGCIVALVSAVPLSVIGGWGLPNHSASVFEYFVIFAVVGTVVGSFGGVVYGMITSILAAKLLPQRDLI